MTIYLSLGANLGKRAETIREALRRIASLPQTQLLAVAPFYETAPWGKLDQPGFINTVAAVATKMSPLDFLAQTQQIEKALGRVRHEHWGARTIDIDLLAATGQKMATEELTLPHPYATERAFVLIPWADIAPDFVLNGKTIGEWSKQPEIKEQELEIAPELNVPYPLHLIASMDAERGIGKKGNLLVPLKEDMEHFKEKTWGQVVIMGRKTLQSLPGHKPLKERNNIVLSHSLPELEGFTVCRDLASLWQELGKIHKISPQRQFWCIGGGEIYELLLPYVAEAEITEFSGYHDADTFLPEMPDFRCVAKKAMPNCRFATYQRTNLLLFQQKLK